MMPVITCVVEWFPDEAIARRLVDLAGAEVGPVHGLHGKPSILRRLHGYNAAARFAPWLVMLDIDSDPRCPADYRRGTLPSPQQKMCYRIVVREAEAWLLADRERIAEFLGVPVARVPSDPESLDDPKRCIVDISRGSRRREIRDTMVPTPGGGRAVGPAYPVQLNAFAGGMWRPEVASLSAPSLSRCIRRLSELVVTEKAALSP
jgi:hypothetical protein